MLTIHNDRHNPSAVEFCRDFLAASGQRRYVLGRNEYAASIAEQVTLDGFIDDYTAETEFLGKPIVKMQDVPKDSLVVSAVIFVVPLTALRNLQHYGLTCLDYFNFCKYSGLPLKEIDFLAESRRHIQENLDEYLRLYDRLADQTSKAVLEKFVNFRVSANPDYLQGFENNPGGQYFEDFLQLRTGEVFVDAGGFDGQTVIDFIARCPRYQSVHFFEPDPHNLKIAGEKLSSYANIHYYNCGLGNEPGVLKFSSGGGSASAVSAAGNIEIQIDTIDRLVVEPVSFIKMDIEGSERLALRGAVLHIRRDHPKLAVCCYHRFDDLLEIPREILSIRDDYSLYLRHYTEGLHESVMFFMPRS